VVVREKGKEGSERFSLYMCGRKKIKISQFSKNIKNLLNTVVGIIFPSR